MSDTEDADVSWALGDDDREHDFQSYLYKLAEARYVMRRVSRILDDQAKQHDLDPLLHQALLQIFGTRKGERIAVHALADRLDIPSGFASRVVGQLEERGLVQRAPSDRDRRVTLLSVTEDGVALLRSIDSVIHDELAHFQRRLGQRQRLTALAVFASYTGTDDASPVGEALRAALEDLG